MALARSWSVALVGVDGHLVEVQADLAEGLPGLYLTGLPDATLGEARDRVRAAVVNSGHAWPNKRMTLGLSPADLPKRGSGFDLALAAALLAAAGDVPTGPLEDLLLLGELGLDGRVRPVAGVLPAVLAWTASRSDRVAVPLGNLAEARLVPGVDAVGVATLGELVAWLNGQPLPEQRPVEESPGALPGRGPDFADVIGQHDGRLACVVAAAGGHNLLMTGPPGCGKTLLAERLPGLLPPLTLEESLEVTAVHSVAGLLPRGTPLVVRPPFQAPHHGTTAVGLVGGGSGLARPGAVSLAHRGVLFLDEAPEFGRTALDALRQPLEGGSVTIRRVGGTATYPARFSLVLAANPCPCGRPDRGCTCTPERRRTYLARLSGPLLDRVDIQLRLNPLTRRELLDDDSDRTSTADLAVRVADARAAAAERYAGTPWRTNADVPGTALAARWPVPRSSLTVAARAMDNGQLSARGYARVQRLAWTAADLAGSAIPTRADVGTALALRLGDLGAQQEVA